MHDENTAAGDESAMETLFKLENLFKYEDEILRSKNVKRFSEFLLKLAAFSPETYDGVQQMFPNSWKTRIVLDFLCIFSSICKFETSDPYVMLENVLSILNTIFTKAKLEDYFSLPQLVEIIDKLRRVKNDSRALQSVGITLENHDSKDCKELCMPDLVQRWIDEIYSRVTIHTSITTGDTINE